MPPESETTKEIEAKTVVGLEAGVKRAYEIALNKFNAEKRMIVVVVTGEPNAGKSRFRNIFQTNYTALENNGSTVRGTIGFNEVAQLQNIHSTDAPILPTQYLIIEQAAISKLVAERNAKRLGLNVDVYVYIYNPNLARSTGRSEKISADLIIINPDSQVK